MEDLFKIAGITSIFFVVTDVKSTVKPGTTIPGTRISVTRSYPEGFDLSICSPSNAERFRQFSAEVNLAFENIVDALVHNKSPKDLEDAALNLFFYWANWGPLPRGTAATGYAALLAVFMAAGQNVLSKIPKMKQMDWESILRTDPADFRDAVRLWISERGEVTIDAKWLDATPGYDMKEIFRTPRDIMTVLAAPDN